MDFMHPVSGPVRRATVEEFLSKFTDDFSRRSLERALLRKGSHGAVMFQNLQMDSRHYGKLAVVLYGPRYTYKTAEELCKQRLGTLPSTFQYPIMYVEEVGTQDTSP